MDDPKIENHPLINKKEWYILLPKHQKGPYSPNTILDLYSNQKIEKKIGLWKEGLPAWKFVDNLSDLTQFLSNYPQTSSQQNPTSASPRSIQELKSILKKIPKVNLKIPHSSYFSYFFLKLQLFIKNNSTYQKILVLGLIWKKKYNRYLKMLSIVVLPLGIAAFFFILNEKIKREETKTYPKKLQKILSLKGQNKTLFSLRLSPKKNEIKVITNSPRKNLHVYLTFESIKNRVLSDKKIIFFANTNIINHIGTINEFYIVQGKKIASGEYKVTLKAESIKNSISKVLFFGDNKEKFESRLANFKRRLLLRNINNQNEVRERFVTLKSLLQHLQNLFTQEVSKISKGSDIQTFAEIYMQQISIIMHGVSINHKSARLKLRANEKFLLNFYDSLMTLGRKTGLLIVDTIDEIKPLSEITDQSKTVLIKKFSNKLTLIQKQVTKNIQSLSSKQKN